MQTAGLQCLKAGEPTNTKAMTSVGWKICNNTRNPSLCKTVPMYNNTFELKLYPSMLVHKLPVIHSTKEDNIGSSSLLSQTELVGLTVG